MSLHERQLRHRKLLKRIADRDAQWWQREYLNALLRDHAHPSVINGSTRRHKTAHPANQQTGTFRSF